MVFSYSQNLQGTINRRNRIYIFNSDLDVIKMTQFSQITAYTLSTEWYGSVAIAKQTSYTDSMVIFHSDDDNGIVLKFLFIIQYRVTMNLTDYTLTKEDRFQDARYSKITLIYLLQCQVLMVYFQITAHSFLSFTFWYTHIEVQLD